MKHRQVLSLSKYSIKLYDTHFPRNKIKRPVSPSFVFWFFDLLWSIGVLSILNEPNRCFVAMSGSKNHPK